MLPARQDCLYDVWNRLTTVSEGGKTLLRYEYDGLGRLIVRQAYQPNGKTVRERRFFIYDHRGRR